ncbi:hypothetical protein PGT21_031686 [Puccinia graminis f. sp. tritici]|uniref:Uncharacterized protein n=1 Tax=Puccinia graminis f. sp. tritici TaxID=56615 RepID=A0A5B0N5R1_PUCGR|nr:hypothetical protein PGT21_031686 [Puccinia graminis f. sp. tritici]
MSHSKGNTKAPKKELDSHTPSMTNPMDVKARTRSTDPLILQPSVVAVVPKSPPQSDLPPSPTSIPAQTTTPRHNIDWNAVDWPRRGHGITYSALNSGSLALELI